MIKSVELILSPEEASNESFWKNLALRSAGISDIENIIFIPRKKSIDARGRKVLVRIVIDLYIDELPVQNKLQSFQLQNVSLNKPVIIIGCGPAGLFAALRLIECGLKPIIIERGKDVKQRRRDLAKLNKERIVNPESNYCFGEGGAGTYSDGKLYTRSGKKGNIQKILGTFIEFGASPEIGYDAHPHIGTNKLPEIISSIRNAIIECGGEIHFNHRFKNFILENTSIKGIHCINLTNDSGISFRSDAVILATGHSARDIFEYFNNENIAIESKPFAIGVRIEHPQKLIDQIQYHCTDRGEYLPAASYSLSSQANKRGVYSFCMCPGGIIATASTAPGELVVNGWSPSKRNNPFANSGIVVSVDDNDFKKFESAGNLKALKFQESIEHKAFTSGGNNLKAPAQRLMDFINHKISSDLPFCSYVPGITPANLDEIFTKEITDILREGFKLFSGKMKGYLTNEAVLVAPESRTSSPVKIPRDSETLMHPQISGLFPCGEGAGYAGGIMSAAMDGERVADGCVTFFHHSKRT